MDSLDSQTLEKIFEKFSIKPEFRKKLQDQTITFEYDNWQKILNKIPSKLIINKFLYIFIKIKEKSIISIYIGKSEAKKTNRLKQHLNGLREIHEGKKDVSDPFYDRFYNYFFQSETELPVHLLIFEWKKLRVLKNILPFDMEVNLANAEALLISTFSSMLKKGIVNHEFITRTKWAAKNISLDSLNKKIYLTINGIDPSSLWDKWCENWFLLNTFLPNKSEDSKIIHIALFETISNKNIVNTFQTKSGKTILKKHPLMIQNVVDSVKIVKKSYDYYSKLDSGIKRINSSAPLFTDGLVYSAYVLNSDLQEHPEFSDMKFKSDIIPLYIGKTESLGRNGGYSANLKGVDRGINHQYFARWGNDDARHFGGLSLRFFKVPNAYPSTNYESWISVMFDSKDRDKGIPRLKIPVYFRMKPWFPFNIAFSEKVGIFTPEIETILIALCRNIFPEMLVNKHNR